MTDHLNRRVTVKIPINDPLKLHEALIQEALAEAPEPLRKRSTSKTRRRALQKKRRRARKRGDSNDLIRLQSKIVPLGHMPGLPPLSEWHEECLDARAELGETPEGLWWWSVRNIVDPEYLT